MIAKRIARPMSLPLARAYAHMTRHVVTAIAERYVRQGGSLSIAQAALRIIPKTVTALEYIRRRDRSGLPHPTFQDVRDREAAKLRFARQQFRAIQSPPNQDE
jgi:hypothetical protein